MLHDLIFKLKSFVHTLRWFDFVKDVTLLGDDLEILDYVLTFLFILLVILVITKFFRLVISLF